MKFVRSNRYLVGEGLSVQLTFSFQRRALAVTWRPRAPASLTAAQIERYQEIRWQFLRYLEVELDATLADPAQALDVVQSRASA